MNDPLAPLGMNAQDGAHSTVGVATVGLTTRRAKVEVSVFSGTHPDDARTSPLGWSVAVGTRGTVYALPSRLDLFYGSASPVGLLVYARVRPC